ncbi:MAG: type II secretion system protein [Candidatus Omnitrophica bacterium]|nr:type II secretion system protein [Candidatus Omnitrophota bacterium]
MKKGLTLVEIIAATVILGITVAGLAGVFIMSKRYVLHNRSRMASGEVARYFLDPLQMDVNQSEWGSNCLSGATSVCPSSAFPDLGDGMEYTPHFDTGNIAAGVRYVTLTLNWTEFTPTP